MANLLFNYMMGVVGQAGNRGFVGNVFGFNDAYVLIDKRIVFFPFLDMNDVV